MRPDDLVPLLTKQPIPGVGFRQGTVLAWDAETADNVVAVGGAQFSNLTVLSASEVKVIQPGDQVSILTLGKGAKSFFILGKVTVPNAADVAIVQSANFETGTSGYSMDRDGSAEFQNITARGDLTVNTLLAGTPGAARVELTPSNLVQVFNSSNELVAELDELGLANYGTNNSFAVIQPGPNVGVYLRPPDIAGHTLLSAALTPVNSGSLPSTQPVLSLVSPQIDSLFTARIKLTGESADSSFPDNIVYEATDHSMRGNVTVKDTGAGDGNLVVESDLTVEGFGWTNFTPKVYSGGGTTQVPGTVSYAKYRQLGKVVWAMATVTFGANATGGAAVDLPVPAAFRHLDCGSCALFGSSVPSTQCGAAVMTSSLDKLVVTSFTGGFLDATSGQNIRYSICYEAA